MTRQRPKKTAFERYLSKGSGLSASEHFWTGSCIELKRKHSLLFLLALAAAISLSDAAASQDANSAQKNPGGDYTLRVNANLVILSATVLDHHNALVSGPDVCGQLQ